MAEEVKVDLLVDKVVNAILERRLPSTTLKVNYYVVMRNSDILRYDSYSESVLKRAMGAFGYISFTDVDLTYAPDYISRSYFLLPLFISTISVPEYSVYRRDIFSWQSLMRYIYKELLGKIMVGEVKSIVVNFYNENKSKHVTIRDPEVADYRFVMAGVRYKDEKGFEWMALEVVDLDKVESALGYTSEIRRRTRISINGDTAVVDTTFGHKIFAEKFNSKFGFDPVEVWGRANWTKNPADLKYAVDIIDKYNELFQPKRIVLNLTGGFVYQKPR